MSTEKALEWHPIFSSDEIDSLHNRLTVINYKDHHKIETIDELLMELEFHFPHLSARLSKLVGSPGFDKEISSLVIDDTGKRQGFPPKVISILLRLSIEHGHKYGNNIISNVWKDNQFK